MENIRFLWILRWALGRFLMEGVEGRARFVGVGEGRAMRRWPAGGRWVKPGLGPFFLRCGGETWRARIAKTKWEGEIRCLACLPAG